MIRQPAFSLVRTASARLYLPMTCHITSAIPPLSPMKGISLSLSFTHGVRSFRRSIVSLEERKLPPHSARVAKPIRSEDAYPPMEEKPKWAWDIRLVDVLRDGPLASFFPPKLEQNLPFTLADWSKAVDEKDKKSIMDVAFSDVAPVNRDSVMHLCIRALDSAVQSLQAVQNLPLIDPTEVASYYGGALRRYRLSSGSKELPDEEPRSDARRAKFLTEMVEWTLEMSPAIPTLNSVLSFIDECSEQQKFRILGGFYKSHSEGKNLLPFSQMGTLLKHRLPMLPEFHVPLEPPKHGEPRDGVNRELLDHLAKQGKSCSVSLISVSGSGKTALMHRALCSTYGVYMTNSAPTETGDTVDHCSQLLSSQVLDASVRGGDLFDATIHQLVQCSYLARAIYLHAVLDNFEAGQAEGEPITPQQFLLFQVNGNQVHAEKVFRELLNRKLQFWRQVPLGDMTLYAFRSLVERLPGLQDKSKRFLFCLDEANVFAKSGTLGFRQVYSVNGRPRRDSLLTIQAQHLASITDKVSHSARATAVVFSGTEFDAEMNSIVQSAVGKTSEVQFSTLEVIGLELMATAEEVIDFLELHIYLDQECRDWIRSKEFSKEFLPLRRRFLGRVLEELPKTTLSYPSKGRLSVAFVRSMESMTSDLSASLVDRVLKKTKDGQDTRDLDSIALQLYMFLVHNKLHTSKYFKMKGTGTKDLEKSWLSLGVASYRPARSGSNATAKDDIVFDTTEPLAAISVRKTLADLHDRFPGTVQSELNTDDIVFDGAIASLLGYRQESVADRRMLERAAALSLIKYNGCPVGELPFLDQDIVSSGLKHEKLQCDKFMSREELFAMLDEKGALRMYTDAESATDQFFWDTLRNEELRHLLFGIIFTPSDDAHPDGILVCPLAGGDGKEYFLVLTGKKALTTEKEENLTIATVKNALQTDPALLYRQGFTKSKSDKVWLDWLRLETGRRFTKISNTKQLWWNADEGAKYHPLVDVPVVRIAISLHEDLEHTAEVKAALKDAGVHLIEWENMDSLFRQKEVIRHFLKKSNFGE